MDSLIKRLQEAEAGSEQLDAAICVALQYGGANSDGAQNVRTDPDWSGDLLFEVNSDDCCNPIPKLTTSLDAIVALIGEKLPGQFWAVSEHPDGFIATLGGPFVSETKAATFSTAPLALCIALLSALQAQGEKP